MTSSVRMGLFGLLLLALVALARAETLTIPGSGNPEYVLGELARAFGAAQKQHQVQVPPTSGTAGALREVAEGTAIIGRVGRPLKDSERSPGLVYLGLGRDPVSFVGGMGVTVKSVTRAQVLDIFSGKLSNWSELGGKPATIRVVGREPTDASSQAIAREIKGFDGLKLGDNVKVVHLDSQAIELLDRFPSSFGFMNRSALSAASTRLVHLALDSVAASPENLASGRYPLALELGLIYKESALTEGSRAFLAFVQSPAGQQILVRHGVLPLGPKR